MRMVRSDDDEVRQLFCIIGVPGAGKSSSLLAALGEPLDFGVIDQPIAHVLFEGDITYLGKLRENNPGADALPFGHEGIVKFLDELPEGSKVVAEGQRVTSNSLMNRIRDELNYDVTIVRFNIDEVTAKERVIGRGGRVKEFTEHFWKRISSQVRNIVQPNLIEVDAGEDFEVVVQTAPFHLGLLGPLRVPDCPGALHARVMGIPK